MQTNYSTFIIDDVLPEDLFNYPGPDNKEFDIQGFLESKNSFLATYLINGKNYSEYLNEFCKLVKQNPKIYLVQLQKEYGLLTMSTEPAQDILKKCLGETISKPVDYDGYIGVVTQHESYATNSHYNFHVKDQSVLIDYSAKFTLKGFRLTIKNRFTKMLYRNHPMSGTPTSIFSSGFWFEMDKNILLPNTLFINSNNHYVADALHPTTNPFYFDPKNKKVYSAEENTEEWVTINCLRVFKQKALGNHGVYKFWLIWGELFPEDLKTYHKEV